MAVVFQPDAEQPLAGVVTDTSSEAVAAVDDVRTRNGCDEIPVADVAGGLLRCPCRRYE